MRIILITQNYLPFMGGVEIHAQQITHEFLKRGHQVEIVAFNFAANKLPRRLAMLHETVLAPSHPSFDDDRVPVHSLTPTWLERLKMLPALVQPTPILTRYFYHGLNRFAYIWYRAALLKRMRQMIKNADVIHCLSFGHLGWLAQDAARLEKIPFVCTPFVHPKQWGDGPDDIKYYQRSKAIIGLVKTDRDYLQSIGVPEAKLHIVGVSPDLPPTQDPTDFRRRHRLEDVPIVLYVGRMMAQKGAEAVVAAAKQVWQKFPQVHFVFIGPGSQESEAWFSGADSRIHYLGRVEKQEKADALAACDIFCMPSMSEILPTVYLEAWSVNKPVIGGKAHGLPDLVEGNQAGFNASQDPVELASTIEKLLGDPALRHNLGKKGHALVEKKYSVEAVTSELLSIYSAACKNGLAAAGAESKPLHPS